MVQKRIDASPATDPRRQKRGSKHNKGNKLPKQGLFANLPDNVVDRTSEMLGKTIVILGYPGPNTVSTAGPSTPTTTKQAIRRRRD
jgi:hypothetical protein